MRGFGRLRIPFFMFLRRSHNPRRAFVFWNKKKGAPLDAPFFESIDQADYTQVITPLVISQTFADCECVAFALQEGGGPATFTATIVTFCEGVNP
jgi:hypothetical protein